MGRLPLVAFVFVAFCNDPVKPNARSEQVAASGSTAPSSSAVASADHATPAAPRGPLCDMTTSRTLPKSTPAFVDTVGTVSERTLPSSDGKRARWISFFASWCGPCKEEFPRIQNFAKRLQDSGVPVDVTFISLDDDLRQLTAFFTAQPAGHGLGDAGMKSSFWLRDGPVRSAWMQSLKMKSDPALPEHAIFDGKSRLKCFISGAIEDGDYAALATALR